MKLIMAFYFNFVQNSIVFSLKTNYSKMFKIIDNCFIVNLQNLFFEYNY